ncbi:hypothetical protein ST47_g8661 [Ascochyta rabiei]|uniref:Uncharacterized protein n=1 Tax=Didymella rabiei TaxID=5454 RepID=A0A162YSB9_DIDRA|nr:hypothetical protein ST47_g8661 [Ascochyta rabiei]
MTHMLVLLASTIFFTTLATTVAAMSVTYDISYSTASALTLDVVVFRLLELFSLFVRGFFDFLQHNLLMPRWAFFMLVIAFVLRSAPPHVVGKLGDALVAPTKSFVHILRLYLDHRQEANTTIITLQKRVADLEEGAILSEKLKRNMIKREIFDSTLAFYDGMIAELQMNTTRLECRLKTSRNANIALQKDYDAALYKNTLLRSVCTAKKQRANEASHKAEMVRMNQVVVDCTTQIIELESKISSLKTRHSNEGRDRLAYHKAQREFQGLLNARDITIDLRNANINSLEIEVQSKNTTIHQLEKQVIMFNNLKKLLLCLVETGDQRQQIAVVICVAYFLSCGIDVTELGIDPLQLQTYSDWATMVINNCPSPLAPTEGLRLKGIRYTLSRSFVRDGQTFAANKLFFNQPLSSSQPHWSPPQHIDMDVASPIFGLNGLGNASGQRSTSSADFDNYTHHSTERDTRRVTSSEPVPALSESKTTSLAASQQPSTPSDVDNSTIHSTQPDIPATASTPLFVFTPSPNTDPSNPTGAPISDSNPAASVGLTDAFQAGKAPGTFGTAASTSSLEDRTSSTPSRSSASNSKSALGSGTGCVDASRVSQQKKKKSAVPLKLSDPLANLGAKLGGKSKKRH